MDELAKHQDAGNRGSSPDNLMGSANTDSNREVEAAVSHPGREESANALPGSVKFDGNVSAGRTEHLVALRAAAIMSLSCFLATVPWLDLAHFSSRGEPREALVAQAIVTSGSWILPNGYGGGVPSKPPLLHWCIAGFSYLFGSGGVSEFTARLPSALASLMLLSYLAYFLARRGWHFAALVAPLLVFFSPEWFRAAVTCRVDMLHSATEAIGLLLLFRWWELGMERLPLGAIAGLSCAVLTKGPVGIVLPAVIFGAFLAIKGIKPLMVFRHLGLVIMPTLALPVVWYAMAAFVGGREFLHTVYDENFGRFFGHMEVPAHVHGVWYLVGALMLGALPMSVSIFAVGGRQLIQSKRKRLRASAVTQVAGKERVRVKPSSNFADKLVARICEIDPLAMFSFITVVATFLFYALPSSKRGVYLLVSYPFLAILVAILVSSSAGKAVATGLHASSRFARVLVHVTKGLIVIASLGVIVGHAALEFGLGNIFFASAVEQRLFPNLGALRLAVLGAALGVGVALLFYSKGMLGLKITEWNKSLSRVAAGLWCTSIIGLAGIFPMAAWRASELRAAESVRIELSRDVELRSFGQEFYGLSFYLGQPIVPLGEAPLQPGNVVLTNKYRVEELDLSPYKLKAEVLRDFSDDKLANSLRSGVMLVLKEANSGNK